MGLKSFAKVKNGKQDPKALNLASCLGSKEQPLNNHMGPLYDIFTYMWHHGYIIYELGVLLKV